MVDRRRFVDRQVAAWAETADPLGRYPGSATPVDPPAALGWYDQVMGAPEEGVDPGVCQPL